jgi:hypothetical protein
MVTDDISKWEGREVWLVGYGSSKLAPDDRPREGSEIKRVIPLTIAELNDGKIKFDTAGQRTCEGEHVRGIRVVQPSSTLVVGSIES